MKTLPQDIASRLRNTLRSAEMTMRNWSGEDSWMFAIYHNYDQFLGTVTLTESDRLIVGSQRLSRAERSKLEALCSSFNSRRPS